jgi:hypothetical protein
MTTNGLPATLFYAEAADNPFFEDSPELAGHMRKHIGLSLQQEGLANDVSFFVNRARKEAGLGVSDKIVLRLNCGRELGWAVLWNYEKLVKNTRTVKLILNEPIVPGWVSAECGTADHTVPVIIQVSKHRGE